jgi:D-alanyl-D-alanine carboxypeptidase
VLNVPTGKKTIKINLRNTNPDLFTYDNILITKTGYTTPAGRCVLMLVEQNNELYAVVVLGQKSSKARSRVVENLLGVDTVPPPKFDISGTVEFNSKHIK